MLCCAPMFVQSFVLKDPVHAARQQALRPGGANGGASIYGQPSGAAAGPQVAADGTLRDESGATVEAGGKDTGSRSWINQAPECLEYLLTACL